MARMHSRKKGKSGSHRPAQKKAAWVGYKPKELEEISVKLASEGRTPAQVGLVLRDQYGVPTVRTSAGRKMKAILAEHKAATPLPEDLNNLLKRAVSLRNHLDGHKHDRYSKRGLELTESKIRRLAKYYKSKNELPEKWEYDPEKAKLWVK